MNNTLLIVLGMAIVTYIPRMLPMVLLQKLRLQPYIKRFLSFIPFAALGALIFPEILFSTESLPSSLVGGLLAVVVALYSKNLILIVLSGILGSFLYQLLFL
ncbi:AzlD domain-containing protein [Isachenkonia alkalipeptolytica]|uniref:AzlD domain-containing protein n=1 Tax=Isachenkonia alkalipeptolytica TaxID=2565777 RepID=A0AA43XLM8_9CLOT|nr:AzlD domain-containing protein [Isachenkonia alkalipeptolytica]NBG88711.1 AzlD domain-containing protein [Isachenkonia alkalipeptolytica]